MTNTLNTVERNSINKREYWEKRLLRMITLEQSNFVFSNLGVEKDVPMNQGTTTYSVRRNNHLPVGDHKLTEGKAPTSLKVEAQKVQGTVNQFGALLKITDWVEDIYMGNVFREYQPELARHAAEVKERDIIESFSDASEYFVNSRENKAALIAGDVLALKDARIVWLAMKNYKRRGHNKYGGKPVCIVHPNVMQDLLDDDDLEKKLLIPGNENQVIKIGTLDSYMAYGVYFQETLIAEIENVGGVNVYTSYMLGEDPYMVLSLKRLQWFSKGFTADSGDPLGQNAHMGYRFWSGAKILDPIAICKIYSTSAYDVAAMTDTAGVAAAQTPVLEAMYIDGAEIVDGGTVEFATGDVFTTLVAEFDREISLVAGASPAVTVGGTAFGTFVCVGKTAVITPTSPNTTAFVAGELKFGIAADTVQSVFGDKNAALSYTINFVTAAPVVPPVDPPTLDAMYIDGAKIVGGGTVEFAESATIDTMVMRFDKDISLVSGANAIVTVGGATYGTFVCVGNVVIITPTSAAYVAGVKTFVIAADTIETAAGDGNEAISHTITFVQETE